MSLSRDADGVLHMGGVSLTLLAEQVGTPAYVYDIEGIAGEARALRDGFEGAAHLVAYAVKANSAGAIVRALAREGCGADVVSGGELRVALGCEVPPKHVIYSGVAKLDAEIDLALGCGERGIGAVQIESVEEVTRVEARARAAGRKARVSVRVNPSVDLTRATHAYIATGHDAAKFGVRRQDVPAVVRLIDDSPDLELVGLATHVGSQFKSPEPYLDGARVLLDLVRDLRDAGGLRSLVFVDTGGGFGVDYGGDEASLDPSSAGRRPADFVRAVREEQRARRLDDLSLYVEPGRALVAPYGALLARVIQSKVTSAARWLMIDAGMNDLLRPALYQARHRIVPLESRASSDCAPWRVVGPVCESSDDFGEHALPVAIAAGARSAVAILDCGAYGYTMASRYNGRQLPVEVFVAAGGGTTATQRVPVATWVEERIRAGS